MDGADLVLGGRQAVGDLGDEVHNGVFRDTLVVHQIPDVSGHFLPRLHRRDNEARCYLPGRSHRELALYLGHAPRSPRVDRAVSVGGFLVLDLAVLHNVDERETRWTDDGYPGLNDGLHVLKEVDTVEAVVDERLVALMNDVLDGVADLEAGEDDRDLPEVLLEDVHRGDLRSRALGDELFSDDHLAPVGLDDSRHHDLDGTVSPVVRDRHAAVAVPALFGERFRERVVVLLVGAGLVELDVCVVESGDGIGVRVLLQASQAVRQAHGVRQLQRLENRVSERR